MKKSNVRELTTAMMRFKRGDGREIDYKVTLLIDNERVMQELAVRAHRNAGLRAAVLGGAVVVKVEPQHPEAA